ncbi:hypothetical protein E6O75_ATG05900 [Venturia nashicola]|uniref:Uncharacterized protein n=1 Tax=Venturia nashicola TaxID=86259 RepID=A0A4Z1P969_9PEZI|nr:hypothetical protein E6O75_ATG05900 [Venturia nashicola]
MANEVHQPDQSPKATTTEKTNPFPGSKLLNLPRELRQALLFHTFNFTTSPFKAYYRIDVIDDLIDRLHTMHAWSTTLRHVHPLLNTDIDFVVTQWEKEYRHLLDDFTNALVGSNTCWLSKFEDGAPCLGFGAVVEVSAWAVRPPVFGWDGSGGEGEGRYCVYEQCLLRWKGAGWTKGTRLRTMRQQQRGRGGTISLPSHRVEEEGEEVGGVEIEGEASRAESKEPIVKANNSTGLSRLITKAGDMFRRK